MSISVEGLLWAKKCLHLVVELFAHKRLGRMSGAAGGLKVPEAQGPEEGRPQVLTAFCSAKLWGVCALNGFYPGGRWGCFVEKIEF